MAVSQTRTGGRPVLNAMALAALAGPGQVARRKLSPEQIAARARRKAFAAQYGLSGDIRDWDSATIEKAQQDRNFFFAPGEAEAAKLTGPTPENVQASVDASRALMDTISSNRAGSSREIRPPVRQTRAHGIDANGVLAALKRLGLS